MKIMPLQPDNMAEAIKNIIENSVDDIFVFPTDVVMNSWTDWIVTHTKKKAVSQERFIAWDNFKSEFVSAHLPGKSVIPSVLRKMFITDLISRNNKEKKFNVIINPEYAKEASFNADWLCDTLRSLHFWKKRYDELVEKNPQVLAEANEYDRLEDEDFNTLYNEYKEFLDKRSLFEPSWVEITEFKEDKKIFHLFYPELLEDFADYEELFQSLPNVNVYKLPDTSKASYIHPFNEAADKNDIYSPTPFAYLYPDARKELRHVMLSIIDIVRDSEKKALAGTGKRTDWSEIALSVPNIETYRPYIQREFDLYGIPYVIKAGISMTKNAAGRVFREIKDCFDSNFSYDSVRTLLLDEYMPWKEDVNKIKESLIREGSRMRCICSVTDDVWLKAFNMKIEKLTRLIEIYNSDSYEKKHKDLKANGDFDSYRDKKIANAKENLIYFNSIKSFYEDFKSGILEFFPEVQSFENIKNAWMNFKEKFFNEENFTEDENNILSRCIVTLNEIIDIEKIYTGLEISSPYDFYLQELDKKTYTSQTKKTGVNIFPYKLSAAAYFKYQFVLDCSQRSIDVSYKRLPYLSDKKRELLLTENEKLNNTSDVFIKLYAKKTEVTDEKSVHFSVATNSFNGFSIPHSSVKIVEILKEVEKNNKKEIKKLSFYPPKYDNDDFDYILQEKNIIKSPDDFTDLKKGKLKLLQSQINSYNNWKTSAINSDGEYKICGEIAEALNKAMKIEKNGKPVISARGTLSTFFPCPRKWMLEKVLNVKEDSLDTNLMKNTEIGSLNHKILEFFMESFMNKKSYNNKENTEEKKLPFYDDDENIFKIIDNSGNIKDFEKDIDSLLENIVEKAINNSGIEDFEESPLALEAIISQKAKIIENIKDFLKRLLKPCVNTTEQSKDVKNLNGIGNCIVMGVEKEFKYENSDFNYIGYIDGYYKTPDNKLVIIDYKNTGYSIPSAKNISVNEDGILGDFQMPVYCKLIENNEKDEIAACYFYSIQKSDSDKRAFTDMSTMDDSKKEAEKSRIKNIETVLDEYSNLFVKTVKDEKFIPVNYDDEKNRQNIKPYDDCTGCPYNSICRTTYTIAGKSLIKVEK